MCFLMTNFKKIIRTSSLLTQKKMIWTFYYLIVFINCIHGQYILDDGAAENNFPTTGIILQIKFINQDNNLIELSGYNVLNYFDENVNFFLTNSNNNCSNNNQK